VVVDPLVERIEEPVLHDELAARAVQPEHVRVLGRRLRGRLVPAATPVGLTIAHVVVAGAVDPVFDAVAAGVVVREIAPGLAVEVGARDRPVGANDGAVSCDRPGLEIGAAMPGVPDGDRPGTVAVR
jgi:hypothetical protein